VTGLRTPTAPTMPGPSCATTSAPDPSPLEAVLAELWRGKVTEQLVALDAEHDGPPLSLARHRELGSRLLEEEARAHNTARLRRGEPALDTASVARVRRAVMAALFGLGGLQGLLDDPLIENINVNAYDNVVLRYADGRREAGPAVAASEQELIDLVRQLAAHAGAEERRFDRASPVLDLQLPDGSRLHAVMEVTKAVSVSIRRHRLHNATLADLERSGMFDREVAEFLRRCVLAQRNILISGSPGAGKTTLLRALAWTIPPWERVLTIEDTFELELESAGILRDVVTMQVREDNIEGVGGIGQAELVRSALRMSPDRVIVGEIRGPEVVSMINCMSQGNDGSMSTVHGSSSQIAFAKLATYAAQGPERLTMEATNLLIASSVHFIVQLDHDTAGRRCVTSIREITGADGPQVVSNEVFRPGPDLRAVRHTQVQPHTQRIFDRTCP